MTITYTVSSNNKEEERRRNTLKFPTSKNSMAHYSLPGYPSTPNEYPNQLVQVPPYRVSNNVSLSQLSHMYKKSQSRPPRLRRRLDSAAAYCRPKGRFFMSHHRVKNDNILHRPVPVFESAKMHSSCPQLGDASLEKVLV